VRIGASRQPGIAPGAPHLLTVPPDEQLAKREPIVIAWSDALEDGTRAFFKLYTHRPAKLTPLRILASIRASREFEGLRRLDEAGVACTTPLFWGRGRSPGRGRVEVLATRLVEGARPLRRALQQQIALADELDWKELLGKVGAMHAAGVHHCGLSTKNVLIDAQRRFFLCDLATSMCYPAAIGHTRMALFDFVQLTHSLGQLLGAERCRGILLEGTGDPELVDRVMAKTARYHRQKRFQHRRLRAEFHLRHLCSR
jgi:hypothetical protein